MPVTLVRVEQWSSMFMKHIVYVIVCDFVVFCDVSCDGFQCISLYFSSGYDVKKFYNKLMVLIFWYITGSKQTW